MTDYMCPADPTVTHCYHAAKVNELIAERDAEIERLREWNREIALNAREFAAENERLRIENIQMQAALGYAIMAEDERHILPTNPYKCGTCDASSYLRAENERLRAALEDVVQEATEHHAENVSRAELGGSEMAQRKAKAIVSRSGVLLYKIRFIARAALDGQPAPGKEEA